MAPRRKPPLSAVPDPTDPTKIDPEAAVAAATSRGRRGGGGGGAKKPNDDLLIALLGAKLTPFEDSDVIRAAIEIPGAAGGLREAMNFIPAEFHKGDELFVLMRCKVKKIRFDPIKDTEAMARVHILDAEEATFVDGEFAEGHLADLRVRIKKIKDELTGQGTLDDVE